MLIEKLIIQKTTPNKEIIREITFKKGLNLIIDNTPNKKTTTGNNVGKSTTIKIINLCLGAKSVKEIYTDNDTKSENTNIKNFLQRNKIQAKLIVLDSKINKRYILKRDLFTKGHRYFNDEALSENDFNKKLNQIFFHIKTNVPSFRQLISKFVRTSTETEEKMLRFIPHGKNKLYEAIYSTLFNFSNQNVIAKKNNIQEHLSYCKKNIKSLENNPSIGNLKVLKQKYELLQNNLNNYYEKRNNISYAEEYQNELKNKRKLTRQINLLQEKIQSIEFDIDIINRSIDDLIKEKSNIDINILKSIYKEAKIYTPNLQKTFEDMLIFHNKMIQNKIDFIKEQLPQKETNLEVLKEQMCSLIKEKEKITIDTLDEDLLDDLNLINNKIEEISQQKGEIIKAINLLEEQYNLVTSYTNQLNQLNSNINENNNEIKIQKFNKIFADYCEKLYGERYLLTYNEHSENFPVEIKSLDGNLGTGTKKALIAVFDLAYMEYANVMNIPGPKFVIHDKLENTHINQLETIFEIADSIEGQYILPILRERIDKLDAIKIKNDTILELSEENKLFKV